VSAARESGKTVEQRGLWFEHYEIGTTYLHRPGRTVTEANNVLFTTLTMNTQALHLDAAWAGRCQCSGMPRRSCGGHRAKRSRRLL
jgi:acyl dehydratase